MTNGEPIVFMVDDDDSFRKVVVRLLESVGLTVQAYGSGDEFLEACDPDQAGCLLLDVRLPGLSGLGLYDVLAARRISLPVVFVTGHGDVPMAVQCMRSGAVDFIEKPFREQVLLDRIRQALEHDAKQRAEQAKHLELRTRLARLTEREQEVLDLVVEGKPNKQIAADLGVSIKAVEAHRSRLMKKMGARCAAELLHIVLSPAV